MLSTSLYPLLPEGVGRRECEGLVSYLCRLAYAHGIAVDDLVARALARTSTEDFATAGHNGLWFQVSCEPQRLRAPSSHGFDVKR